MTDTPDNNDEPFDAFLKRIIPNITPEQLLLVVGRFAENAADAFEEGYGEGYERGQQDGYAHGWYRRGLD